MESRCNVRELIKNFFHDACEMTVKTHDLHLFPVPPNRMPYNKLLTCLVFSVQIVNIMDPFFFKDLWPMYFALGQQTGGKNSVLNLQYGPRARQMRGTY